MSDGKVVIDTKLDDKPVQRGILKIKDSMNSLGGTVKSVGSSVTAFSKNLAGVTLKGVTAGITATTAAIGGLVGKSVSAYSSYEQLVGGVDTLFKNSSKKVQKYADNAYKTAQLSANEYMETVTSFSASLLQGLKGDTNKAADKANKAIIDMSDNANKMGTDMQMIQNAYQGFAKQNYTMLDNLKLGYGGTASEMARLVKDSGVLGKAGDKLTAKNLNTKVSFDQIVDAIHIVQTNLGITGTSAKEASTTIEGSVNSMKSAWANLSSGFAQDNAKIDKLINQFVTSAVQAFNNISPRIELALQGIGDLIDKMGPIIAKKLPKMISNVLPDLITSGITLFTLFVTSLAENLPGILEKLSTSFSELPTTILSSLSTIGDSLLPLLDNAVQTITEQLPEKLPQITQGILDFFSKNLENPPEAITIGTNLLKSIIKGCTDSLALIGSWVTENTPTILNSLWSGVANILDKLSQKLPSAIPLLVKGVTDLLENLVTWLSENKEEIVTKLGNVAGAIVDGVMNSLPSLNESVGKMIEKLIPFIMTMIPKFILLSWKIVGKIAIGLIKALPSLFVAIKNIILAVIKNIRTYFDKFKKVAGDIFKTIKKAITDKLDQAKEIGKNLVKGIWNGINSVKDWIGKKIGEFATGITDKVKEIFGIHSPSTVMRDEVGRFLAQGIWVGFDEENPMDKINKQLQGSLKTTSSIVADSVGSISSESYTPDYSKLADVFVESLEKSGLSIQIGERQFGRIVRSVI